jgi:ABC-2 type transport system ATP-binding protein
MSKGCVFALLGPNGAGKTTAVRVLSTLIRADAGQARVAGFDVLADRHEVRRRISLTGQYAAVDELQTGEENVQMVGRLRGLGAAASRQRAIDLLERFELTDAGRRRVGTYSGGMRRRLDLAMGLVGDPIVVFLDEPTTGLDVRSRREVWAAVRELVGYGTAVLLTTQYLEEADRLADRIALLDGGKIVAEGTPKELKRRVSDQRLELTLTDGPAFAEISARLGDRAVHANPGEFRIGVETDGSGAHVRALLDELDPDGSAVAQFGVHSSTLDDVFLTLTGHATSHPQQEAANV